MEEIRELMSPPANREIGSDDGPQVTVEPTWIRYLDKREISPLNLTLTTFKCFLREKYFSGRICGGVGVYSETHSLDATSRGSKFCTTRTLRS